MSAALEMLTGEPGPMCAAALNPPAPPAPAELRDLLPEHNGRRGVLVWLPYPQEVGHLAGFARLEMPGDVTTYSVSEGPTDAGRAFLLRKYDGMGTAKRRESYLVRCSHAGEVMSCECDGYRRWKHCKHGAACSALIVNGWV